MIRGWFAGRRGRIHFRRWEPGGRPVALLVLLHGLGEHSGQYGPLAEAAAEMGVGTWALDQAGHGYSDGERVLVESVDDLVADAETLLTKARSAWPRVPVVVAGHSLGATVATLLVGEIRTGTVSGPAADPAADTAGLVLAGSSLLDGGQGLSALLASGVDPMELRKDPSELVRDPEQARLVREDPLVWDGGLRPQTLAALTAAGARTRAAVTDGALDHLPVLLLHGAEDDIAPAAGAVAVGELLPRARVVVYPGDRHNVLHELDRGEVHAELLRFVAAVTSVPTP
ncbi:alpha/beta fold hydrolase [Pseudonocardia xinjiangensis]|uniref:Alpha/beta hydrolase n=1 Tax=Pseudonocardia xinjiangensis TaxID=75289 RepID=A0ABX1RIN6_9PSEU|nr:alpha/beta fold hydrolase [Pseudonocardia xinjiangensis]NMH79852.1 alpha/beta hydrolase [Pseudonocardia xinjiangensis]